MKPKQIAHVVWHAQPATEVVAALETGDRGLTDAEAKRRRQAFGANVLPRPKRRGPLVVYLAQFKSPMIYLLVAAAAVSLAIGELTDALFIFAVLQINAVIGVQGAVSGQTVPVPRRPHRPEHPHRRHVRPGPQRCLAD